MKGSRAKDAGVENERGELPDMLVFVGDSSRESHRRSTRSDLTRARVKILRVLFFDSRSRHNAKIPLQLCFIEIYSPCNTNTILANVL